jgi:hypothetical protein
MVTRQLSTDSRGLGSFTRLGHYASPWLLCVYLSWFNQKYLLYQAMRCVIFRKERSRAFLCCEDCGQYGRPGAMPNTRY